MRLISFCDISIGNTGSDRLDLIDFPARILGRTLSWLISATGSVGLSLVLMGAALQILLYSWLRASSENLAKLQAMQPELDTLKKKHHGNQELLNSELLALYRRHGTNPAAGCLPQIVWIIVVVAMWRVFVLERTAWHHAHFLWIAPGAWHDAYPSFIAGNLAGFDAVLVLVVSVACGLAYLRTRSPQANAVAGVLVLGLIEQWAAGPVLYWGTFAFFQILLHPKSGLQATQPTAPIE